MATAAAYTALGLFGRALKTFDAIPLTLATGFALLLLIAVGTWLSLEAPDWGRRKGRLFLLPGPLWHAGIGAARHLALLVAAPCLRRAHAYPILGGAAPFPSTHSLRELYAKVFGYRESGTFCEVGAGAMGSFCAGLADVGWSGHLIEPVPTLLRALATRHAGNPGVRCHGLFIGPEDGLRVEVATLRVVRSGECGELTLGGSPEAPGPTEQVSPRLEGPHGEGHSQQQGEELTPPQQQRPRTLQCQSAGDDGDGAGTPTDTAAQEGASPIQCSPGQGEGRRAALAQPPHKRTRSVDASAQTDPDGEGSDETGPRGSRRGSRALRWGCCARQRAGSQEGVWRTVWLGAGRLCGGSWGRSGRRATSQRGGTTPTVESQTLDSFLQATDWAPGELDLLVIGPRGYAWPVLSGASLGHWRPACVIVRQGMPRFAGAEAAAVGGLRDWREGRESCEEVERALREAAYDLFARDADVSVWLRDDDEEDGEGEMEEEHGEEEGEVGGRDDAPVSGSVGDGARGVTRAQARRQPHGETTNDGEGARDRGRAGGNTD